MTKIVLLTKFLEFIEFIEAIWFIKNVFKTDTNFYYFEQS